MFEKLKGGLIVSCQALPDEPMHSSFIMGRFARAAVMGGAVGIRANTRADIEEIKKEVDVPIIGIVKRIYKDCDVYITPTMDEIDEVAASGADIAAVDATARPRPDGVSLEDFVGRIRKKYPKLALMADTATFEEAKNAEKLGFDFIGTTLRGYTEETKDIEIPDFDYIKSLVDNINLPIIAEGGIHTPEEFKRALEQGVFCCVVGGAITRPLEITRRFTAMAENK